MHERIAYVRVDSVKDASGKLLVASVREQLWTQMIPWLDQNCPTWMLAYRHAERISLLRRVSHLLFMGETSHTPQPVKLSMTPNEVTLFKLFWGDQARIESMGEFDRMSHTARRIGAQMAAYRGPPEEYPVELLNETAKIEIMTELLNQSLRQALR